MTDAENILQKSLDNIAAEQGYKNPEYKIKKVSTEGANFSSYLFEATISSKGKDDLSLFAKVAAVGEKMREIAARVFDVERLFYTELMQEYRQLERKHGVPVQHQLKVPKLYACNSTMYEETVVMENLATKGYILHDRFVSVDWEYAAAAFTEAAKLHALSVALKHYKPEIFKKCLEDYQFQLVIQGDMKPMIEKAIKIAIESTKEENRGKLLAFVSKIDGFESFMKYFLPGERPMIRHGDYRPSNILHKVKDDGSIDLIPVDFQTLTCGSPVIDLFYFIFLGTDKQFRDQYYEKLLDHYYEQLSASMSRLGLDPEKMYSRKTFDEEVKENIYYGLFVSVSTLGLITVDSADAPEVSEDLDIAQFMQMKISTTFVDRLNGIIDDFVRWGLL